MACPSGFTLITEPVRGCGRAPGEAATCKSVIFSSGGQLYSRVCGRVNAYHRGSPDAFQLDAGINELYRRDIMWMVSPLIMELQAHVSTSGPLLPHAMKLHRHTFPSMSVPSRPALTLK